MGKSSAVDVWQWHLCGSKEASKIDPGFCINQTFYTHYSNKFLFKVKYCTKVVNCVQLGFLQFEVFYVYFLKGFKYNLSYHSVFSYKGFNSKKGCIKEDFFLCDRGSYLKHKGKKPCESSL